jgi:hypothetical protein
VAQAAACPPALEALPPSRLYCSAQSSTLLYLHLQSQYKSPLQMLGQACLLLECLLSDLILPCLQPPPLLSMTCVSRPHTFSS